ncbi:RimK family alpha-L-glutamate ligase [Patescibacteria group bacterium]
MNIGILQFKPGATIRSKKLPEDIKMLKKAVIELGHTPKIIREDKCQFYFPIHKPQLLYAGKPFPKVDVIIPRMSALSNVALRATILQQLEAVGIPVLQSYTSTVRAKNKLRTMQLLTRKQIPVPRTIVVKRFEYLDTAIKKVGGFPIIIKTPTGSMGKGVAIVETKRALNSAFDMLLTSPSFSYMLIQEYVEEAEGKDIRVFTLEDKILTAMERSAEGGDFRSNLALGGVGKVAKLSKEEEEIALAAAKALNLSFSGVDLLRSKHGPVVMEVNCNPGLEGITEVTGVDVAKEIVKYAVKFAEKSS